jgi:sigma-54 dependent transcriptional regulator, acetoin dehydrogenase operon transcriptional activator AcoR
MRHRARSVGAEAGIPAGATLNAALGRSEREAVEKALKQTNGNVADAAAVLGVLRTSLYRIMKRFGITRPARARS